MGLYWHVCYTDAKIKREMENTVDLYKQWIRKNTNTKNKYNLLKEIYILCTLELWIETIFDIYLLYVPLLKNMIVKIWKMHLLSY